MNKVKPFIMCNDPTFKTFFVSKEKFISFSEFIVLFAPDVPVLELFDFKRKIQENDIIVDVSNLRDSQKLTCDNNIRECVKMFFTRKAWDIVLKHLDNSNGINISLLEFFDCLIDKVLINVLSKTAFPDIF